MQTRNKVLGLNFRNRRLGAPPSHGLTPDLGSVVSNIFQLAISESATCIWRLALIWPLAVFNALIAVG